MITIAPRAASTESPGNHRTNEQSPGRPLRNSESGSVRTRAEFLREVCGRSQFLVHGFFFQ
jgi:hypothetical protein